MAMVFDSDALEPAPKKATVFPVPDMEPLSIAELQDYIQRLEAEIDRARQAIAQKGDHRSAADSFFKS